MSVAIEASHTESMRDLINAKLGEVSTVALGTLEVLKEIQYWTGPEELTTNPELLNKFLEELKPPHPVAIKPVKKTADDLSIGELTFVERWKTCTMFKDFPVFIGDNIKTTVLVFPSKQIATILADYCSMRDRVKKSLGTSRAALEAVYQDSISPRRISQSILDGTIDLNHHYQQFCLRLTIG